MFAALPRSPACRGHDPHLNAQSGPMEFRGATTDFAALVQARQRKELRYPELTGEHLVLLACETGGEMVR